MMIILFMVRSVTYRREACLRAREMLVWLTPTRHQLGTLNGCRLLPMIELEVHVGSSIQEKTR